MGAPGDIGTSKTMWGEWDHPWGWGSFPRHWGPLRDNGNPPPGKGSLPSLCPTTLGYWGALGSSTPTTGEPYWDPWGCDTGAPSLGMLWPPSDLPFSHYRGFSGAASRRTWCTHVTGRGTARLTRSPGTGASSAASRSASRSECPRKVRGGLGWGPPKVGDPPKTSLKGLVVSQWAWECSCSCEGFGKRLGL